MKFFSSGSYFPFFIILLLLVSVGSNVYLMLRATGDASFAVEPDYYKKAVDYDKTAAAERASEALGWKPTVQMNEDKLLELSLADRLDRPVTEATVKVEAFPIARSQRFLHAELVEKAPGRYVWERPLDKTGIWEFRLSADRGDEHFVHKARLTVIRYDAVAQLRSDGLLELSLRNKEGKPLEDAFVTLRGNPVGDPERTVRADLDEDKPGHYVWRTRPTEKGAWDLYFKIERDDEDDDEHFAYKTQLTFP